MVREGATSTQNVRFTSRYARMLDTSVLTCPSIVLHDVLYKACIKQYLHGFSSPFQKKNIPRQIDDVFLHASFSAAFLFDR